MALLGGRRERRAAADGLARSAGALVRAEKNHPHPDFLAKIGCAQHASRRAGNQVCAGRWPPKITHGFQRACCRMVAPCARPQLQGPVGTQQLRGALGEARVVCSRYGPGSPRVVLPNPYGRKKPTIGVGNPPVKKKKSLRETRGKSLRETFCASKGASFLGENTHVRPKRGHAEVYGNGLR